MGGFSDARDEIYGQLTDATFLADLLALLGYAPAFKYWGVNRSSDGDDMPPEDNQIYLMASVKHGTSGETLAGALGAHSYEYQGTVTVQIFEPSYHDLSQAESVCELVRARYRGVRTAGSPSVWFTDARIVEVGQTPSGMQFNVSAVFRYDEVA